MSNHENQGTGYDSGAVGHETVGRADRPEPLSTGFERVYAEIHGEPVKPFTEAERRKFRGSNCFICGYNGANYFQPSIHACARRYHADEEVYAAALESAVERLQRELDEARGIVRNIYWMACRYADGRNTYAPGMYNRAIAKAYDAGWLTFDHTGRRYEVQYARDGMSPEWKTAEERAISAEASLAKAIAERDEARAKADENWKLAEYERHDANHWHIQFEAATNALKDLTGAFSIYTVEGEDGIRLSTGGKVVANYSEHSEGGIALLRLEAQHRAARAILGDQPT